MCINDININDIIIIIIMILLLLMWNNIDVLLIY